MAKNENLHKASKAKNDEFYTQLSDIENELKHYKEYFKDKIVFCNCDDPYESNFFKYFAMNFNILGIKKLIATCYATSPVANTQIALSGWDESEYGIAKEGKEAYKIEISEVPDLNGDGATDLSDVENLIKSKNNILVKLCGDGDFRSEECIELLKEADIVVTNPPFSLFREYVAQLMEYEKKFIIIGNQNAITYKEIFPLLKENKMWLGYGFNGGNAYFAVPRETNYAVGVYNKETGLVKFRNCCWFTNVDTTKRHEELFLWKAYNVEEYPKYDNYDAIEVSKTADIPCDYNGIMGVPITFLDKYNPKQFEVLGITDRQNSSGLRTKKYTIGDSPQYNDLNARSVLKTSDGYKQVYARILIRKRK